MAFRSTDLIAEDNDFFRHECLNQKLIDFDSDVSLGKEEREQLVDAIRKSQSRTSERQVGLCNAGGKLFTWVVLYFGRHGSKANPFTGPVKRSIKVYEGDRT